MSNIVTFSAANHTSGGSKVIRMNQSYAVGPAKKLKVYPGDQVDVEVWTYYETASGYGTSSPTVAAMVSSIATAFGGVNGGSGESGMIYNAVNSALGVFGLSGNQGNTAPAAYLNYMLYDQNYNLLKMGWKVVPTSANFAKQKISFSTFNIKEPGILFVYLSYEDLSNNYVYFDDFKVQHTKSIVIQGNEYYPFGMQTVNCWTRENNTANNFLANGGTEYNATSSLYDLDYRTFDPVLGRMNGVDPMAAKYAGLSPYNYSFNDPVNFADPGGADPSDPNYAYNPGGTDYGDPNWLTRFVWSGYVDGIYTGYDVAVNRKDLAYLSNPTNHVYREFGESLSGGASMSIFGFLSQALSSSFGGSWSNGQATMFENSDEAFLAGYNYNNFHDSWGSTVFQNSSQAFSAYVDASYSEKMATASLEYTPSIWTPVKLKTATIFDFARAYRFASEVQRSSPDFSLTIYELFDSEGAVLDENEDLGQYYNKSLWKNSVRISVVLPKNLDLGKIDAIYPYYPQVSNGRQWGFDKNYKTVPSGSKNTYVYGIAIYGQRGSGAERLSSIQFDKSNQQLFLDLRAYIFYTEQRMQKPPYEYSKDK